MLPVGLAFVRRGRLATQVCAAPMWRMPAAALRTPKIAEFGADDGAALALAHGRQTSVPERHAEGERPRPAGGGGRRVPKGKRRDTLALARLSTSPPRAASKLAAPKLNSDRARALAVRWLNQGAALCVITA